MHQFLFYNKFIICLYMFRALCAHHQEVKTVLYSLWYHHTCRWPSHAQVEVGHLSQPVHAKCTCGEELKELSGYSSISRIGSFRFYPAITVIFPFCNKSMLGPSWNGLQLLCHIQFCVLKSSPLQGYLQPGEQKEVAGCQI